MSEDIEVFFNDDDEPELMIYKGKDFEWNGAFLVDINILKEMKLESLPVNLPIQPIISTDEDGVISTTEFTITYTEEGQIVIDVEGYEYSKYWTHPIVSLSCYIENKLAEIKEDSEFNLDYFEDDGVHYNYGFHFTIMDTTNIEEVLFLAEQSLSALERRVRRRIVETVKNWAEEAS